MDPNAKNDDPASAAEAEARRRMEGGAAVPWEYPPGGTGGDPQIDRAITAVEEGAVEALAKLLDAALCGVSGTWDYNSASDKEAWRREARYLLAHATELRNILSSVQSVEPSAKEPK